MRVAAWKTTLVPPAGSSRSSAGHTSIASPAMTAGRSSRASLIAASRSAAAARCSGHTSARSHSLSPGSARSTGCRSMPGLAGDLRHVVQVRDRVLGTPPAVQRHRGIRAAEGPPPDQVAVPVDVHQQPGARANLDEVHRAVAPPSDGPQREAERDCPPQNVRLDEPAGDELRQRRAVLPTEVKESRACICRIESDAAGHRGVVVAQAVLSTAQQQLVHRPEQQKGRLLAGPPPRQQPKQLPVRGHDQAQRLVQGRGSKDGRRLAEMLRQGVDLGALGHASPSGSGRSVCPYGGAPSAQAPARTRRADPRPARHGRADQRAFAPVRQTVRQPACCLLTAARWYVSEVASGRYPGQARSYV